MSDQQKKSNWFKRHKVLTVLIVIVVLGIVIGASGGSNSNSNNGVSKSSGSSEKQYRFADRADKQDKDVEAIVGETATVGGVKMTVSKAEYKTSLSEFETAPSGKTYIIADVTLENTTSETKAYNTFDFRLQTAGGQVLDSTFSSTGTPLNSGDLVAGGKATGQVVFEAPLEEGHQYIIWKPSAWSSDRAIVQVK